MSSIDTGLNRNVIDKYYTKTNIVKYCITLIKKYIKIDKNNDLIIEPSAGSGSFIPYINDLSSNRIYYDIKPEHTNIIKKNFLKLSSKYISELINKYNKIHIIGNPPFGRQSSLAIKFIKKSCEFCDSISFILPKSFKKDSLKNKIPLNFHLLIQKDLPKYSFTVNDIDYDVPCVFQIWIKKPYDRKKHIKNISKYFIFVNKLNNPDIAIRRIGVNAGKLYEDVTDRNVNSHYFIKIKKELNKKNIIKVLKDNKYNNFNNSVGPLSISKQELINFYNAR
jgi:predicted RNA methylase